MKQDISKFYFMGMEYYKESDYVNARKYFELSYTYSDGECRAESLQKLIQIDLREGKYAKVRKLLEENSENQTVKLKQMYGLLENIENNFEASKRYYSECMTEKNMQNIALLSFAKLYIQIGDYEVSRKMLETLQFNDSFKIQATICLTCLNILEKNYENAWKILEDIQQKELTDKLQQQYHTLEVYIRYFLGNLAVSNNCDLERDYIACRLLEPSDDVLLHHIERHKKQYAKKNTGYFLEHIDLKKLLADARDIIENRNANHFEASDMYRFRLDRPVGLIDEEETNDLCVVTIIGTKKILTMYPISLSDEFDKEGFSTNKKIMLKRK